MKKGLKRSLKITGIILGALLLVLIVAALLVLFHKPLVRNVLQSQLEKRTGMTVRIGRLDYRLFPLRVTVGSLAVGQEDAFQKMDVTLTRLEAEGHLGKLFRGERPAFERVIAEGFEVLYVQKAVNPEPVDYEAIVRQLADLLAQAERIELKSGRVTASLPPQALELEDVRLELAASGNEGRDRTFLLECGAFRAAGADGSFSVTGGLRAAGLVTPGPTTAVNLRAAVLSPRISAMGIEPAFGSLLLEADGIWEMAEGRISVSRLSAGIPGLLDVTGAAAAAFKGQRAVEVYAAVRFEDLEEAAALFRDRLPLEFREALVRGQAGAEVRYALAGPPGTGTQDLRASVKLEGVELDHTVSGIPVRAKIDGGLEIDGLPPAFSVSAGLRSSLAGFSVGQARIGRSTVRIRGKVTPDAADIAQINIRIDGLTLPVEEGKEIRFDQAALSGRATLDLRKNILVIPALRAVLPPLPPIDLTGRLDLGDRGRRSVRLGAKGFKVPTLREFLGPFVPAALAEWDAGGTFDLSARAANAGRLDGDWDVSADLTFSDVAFNDPSFTFAGEGLSPALRLEGKYGPAGGGIPFSVSLSMNHGESLFKSFYVSWDKHPVDATFGGLYEPGPAGIEALEGRILFPTIGQLDVAGSARTSPGPSFDLRCDVRLALAPFYSLYTQAGVAEESRMRLEGDLTAGLEVVGKEDGGLAVRGRLTLADTALENPASKLLMTGISADIPVHHESAVAGPDASADDFPEQGFLRIGDLQSPFLTLSGLDIGLRAGVNAYAIAPLRIDLFGGRLETGPTTVRIDPKAGTIRGLGSLALRDLDISLFPVASPQFKLTGKVRAEFPSLDFTAERIAVAGRGEADVFGGQVILRDLAVDRPFTEARTISLNLDLLDLDLKRLTDEVPFGEVTGIVRGEVRNLVLSYGQPERFEFRIESVSRKGVPQTFSLKAVDNLTVLSSGEQASGGTSQFWMRFIKGFRYEKLGIVSTLRNDTFTLNGTIREGGVEYLVKKPALFGISVVNRMPDKVISFKEMTNRLKRVGQSEK